MTLEQNHTGHGNNVGRDLISISQSINGGSGNNVGRDLISISQSVSADSLTSIIRDLMYHVATNSFEIALKTIEIYSKLNLSEEVEILFKILTSYIDVFKSDVVVDTSLLKAELNNRDNSKFISLYQAILIKFIAKTSMEEARKAYLSFDKESNFYLFATFDQYFASKEELQSRFDQKLFILDDYSLFYLALGFWRVHDYKSSNMVFQNISTIGKNETIQYWLIATQLNSIIYSNETQLSYPDQKTSQKIAKIANDFVKLTSGKVSLSSLSTSILVALVKLTMSNIYLPEIRAIGLEYRQDIEKIDKKLGETLYRIAEKEVFEAPDWLISKLNNNQTLKEDEIDTLIRIILFRKIDMILVEKWLIQSEISLVCEEFYNNFLKVYLISFKQFNNTSDENEYRIALDSFLNNYSSRLKDINPITIKHWCDNLYGISSQFDVSIYKILKAVCKDLAVNTDLNYYYLQSLLRLDKLTTMRKELDRVEDDEWGHDLYLFQARYYLRTKNYLEAQKAYLKFIDDEKNLYIWHEFLESCMENGKNIKLAQEQLYRIPASLLSPEDNGFQSFIFQVANFIDFDFSERTIVKLFLERPIDNASITTKFYFNCFLNRTDMKDDENKKFDGIHFGVIYKARGKINTALIVDNKLAKHKELIGIQTDLGQLLVNSSEGDEAQYNFNKVTLLNYQSVNATIYQLAIQIVSDVQHTYDEPIFYQPEINQETLIEDTIKTLQLSKSKNPIEESIDELLRNQDLSLYTKGRLITEKRLPAEEVEVAYNLLLNRYSNQCLTKVGGNVDVIDAVVIDIYGAIYLCITNLHKSIIASDVSIYISKETSNIIQLWIDNVTNDKFLMLNEFEGKLFRTDATSIRKKHGNLIDALNQLMNYVEVDSERVFDLPTFASEMKRLVSDSVFSSVKLSLSLDIGWLCLDSLISNILVSSIDCKIVDFQKFVHSYISNESMTFEDRRDAIIHSALSGFYTEYYLADLVILAKDINNFFILSQLLNDTFIEFPESQTAVIVLVQIMKSVIQIGFKTKLSKKEAYGKRYLGLSVKFNMNGIQGNITQKAMMENVLYACFNKAIKCIEGASQEERLAKLIIELIKLQKTKSHREYSYEILESFIFRYFLSIEGFYQSIDILINEEIKKNED